MINPMEIFAQLATSRALSDLAPRQRGSSDFGGSGSPFDSIFDQAQATRSATQANSRPAQSDTAPEQPGNGDRQDKPRPIETQGQETDCATAAQYIVAEYKENVAVILEGDRKSGTLPEYMSELATGSTEDDADLQKLLEQMKKQQPEVKEPPAATEPEITAQDVKEAHAKAKAEAYTPEVAKEAAVAEGEVAARMPDNKTLARSDLSKEPEQSKSASNGDLSPLENGSDTAKIKDNKETAHFGKDTGSQAEEKSNGDVNYMPANFTEALKAETLRSEQQVKQAEQQHVTPENLFDEMVSRLDSMHSEGRQTMVIELKPEFLGKLGLQLTIDGAGLHIKIDASDPSVRNLVSSQLTTLVQQLEQKGLEVVEVEVMHTGIDNGNFNSSNQGYAYAKKSSQSFGDRAEDKNAAYATAIELHEYYLEMGVSSVEYRA